MQTMRIKLNMRNVRPKHYDPTVIAICTAHRELKIKRPPQRKDALAIALEPQAAQINSFIQQLHIHFRAAPLRRHKSALLYTQGTAPVINSQDNECEPENGLQIKHGSKAQLNS